MDIRTRLVAIAALRKIELEGSISEMREVCRLAAMEIGCLREQLDVARGIAEEIKTIITGKAI